ncbi:putative kinase suppressor of Ras 2-like [Scophthalmus maximus]|uniref:Putative kinase suppressor of Ras 2-like n=1 Tax=Scophthalmus maximus TaxID=52904 RepID=A0A2U9BV93_SCOMX|nr:putative kinase suppressor of Ras 2-like [Scophthalmus maximus]
MGGKLVKYFSRQLSCKCKVALEERSAELEDFPRLGHWFRIVNLRKEVTQEMSPGEVTLEGLLEMNEEQVCELLQKFGANEEESARLNASLSCLRKAHQLGSQEKQDWSIQWPTSESGKENTPVGQPEASQWIRFQLSQSPKVQSKYNQHMCHSPQALAPPLYVDRLTVDGPAAGLFPPLDFGHRSLPPSPRQRHFGHTPPRTPLVINTMTPPGTPPMRRRNKVKAPGTPPPPSRKLIHLLPGFTALHRSKSHEFQLGNRLDDTQTPNFFDTISNSNFALVSQFPRMASPTQTFGDFSSPSSRCVQGPTLVPPDSSSHGAESLGPHLFLFVHFYPRTRKSSAGAPIGSDSHKDIVAHKDATACRSLFGEMSSTNKVSLHGRRLYTPHCVILFLRRGGEERGHRKDVHNCAKKNISSLSIVWIRKFPATRSSRLHFSASAAGEGRTLERSIFCIGESDVALKQATSRAAAAAAAVSFIHRHRVTPPTTPKWMYKNTPGQFFNPVHRGDFLAITNISPIGRNSFRAFVAFHSSAEQRLVSRHDKRSPSGGEASLVMTGNHGKRLRKYVMYSAERDAFLHLHDNNPLPRRHLCIPILSHWGCASIIQSEIRGGFARSVAVGVSRIKEPLASVGVSSRGLLRGRMKSRSPSFTLALLCRRGLRLSCDRCAAVLNFRTDHLTFSLLNIQRQLPLHIHSGWRGRRTARRFLAPLFGAPSVERPRLPVRRCPGFPTRSRM